MATGRIQIEVHLKPGDYDAEDLNGLLTLLGMQNIPRAVGRPPRVLLATIREDAAIIAKIAEHPCVAKVEFDA